MYSLCPFVHSCNLSPNLGGYMPCPRVLVIDEGGDFGQVVAVLLQLDGMAAVHVDCPKRGLDLIQQSHDNGEPIHVVVLTHQRVTDHPPERFVSMVRKKHGAKPAVIITTASRQLMQIDGADHVVDAMEVTHLLPDLIRALRRVV